MTVNELAQFAGKDERTVQRWIKKAGGKTPSVASKMSSAGHGKAVDYTIDEVEAILSASTLPKAVVDKYAASARAGNTQVSCVKPDEPTMTIQELVSFTGKSERCVRGWISKAGIKTPYAEIAEGKRHGYTIDEVEAILNASSMSRDAVSILMQNARNHQTLAGNDVSSSLSDREIEMITRIVSATVAMTVSSLNSRMEKIEDRIDERQALLPAPQVKPRDHVNMLVRSYAGESGIPHKDCWKELYRQFGYRTNTNPKKCAENRGMGILDYIETEGQIEILESVAMDIYGESDKERNRAARAGESIRKAVEEFYGAEIEGGGK